jgi:DNA excision repair protein ERCC-4
MIVKIDSREQSRLKSATKYFEEQGLEVSVEELEIGDYIFSDGNDEVVFEFKLISDFISSIQEGRVFNQCISQAENFNHHFCIIHGDLATRSKCIAMTKNYRQVTVFQYISAICSINIYSTVIQVSSPFINESYYTMMTQAKKCLQNKPIVRKFPRKHKNPAFNWLCYCNYGINAKKATAIIETLNLHTLNDLQQLTIEKLMTVDGIGKKNAEKIIEGIK